MKEYVAASGTLPSFEMLQRMTESVCDVLEAVHSVGLIHRDISPDNIFMCQNGTFKLIDFGSVKQGINNNNLSATVILKNRTISFYSICRKFNCHLISHTNITHICW